MSEQTLFLAWHYAGESYQWFPVGRLDADVPNSKYRFRYTGGAMRVKQAGYSLIMEFPDLERDYLSPRLFALFQNRVMKPYRPDFPSYVKVLGLSGVPDPIEILAVNGGRRMTDNYEVFPQPVRQSDGSFVFRFLLHGSWYVSQSGQERLKQLEPGEELLIALELTHPATRLALQIQTQDRQIIGWTPHCLAQELAMGMSVSAGKFAARVVQIEYYQDMPGPAGLVELRCLWDNYEPMSGRDYRPLVD